MSASYDDKVVSISFDNKNFEANVATTIRSLKDLQKSLQFLDGEDAFKNIESSADKVDLSGVSRAAEKVGDSFTVMGRVCMRVVDEIAGKIYGLGKDMANFYTGMEAFSPQNIATAWNKANQKTGYVQTMVNATGKTSAEIDGYLNQILTFADETSFSFDAMASSMATMLSAGGELENVIPMIMGIANATAYAGKTNAEFQRTIYNLNQSYSSGSLKLADWRSVELAGVNSKGLMKSLIEAGEALEAINPGEVTLGNFRESLSKGWANKAVMETAFREWSYLTTLAFDGIEKGIYNNFEEAYSALSKDLVESGTLEADAYQIAGAKAAQQAKTFGEAITSVTEAVTTKVMTLFDTVFGNYEQQVELWSRVAVDLWDIFAGPFGSEDSVAPGIETLLGAAEEAGVNVEKLKKELLMLGHATGEVDTGIANFSDVLDWDWLDKDSFLTVLDKMGVKLKETGKEAKLTKEALNPDKMNDAQKYWYKTLISGEYAGSAVGSTGRTKAVETLDELADWELYCLGLERDRDGVIRDMNGNILDSKQNVKDLYKEIADGKFDEAFAFMNGYEGQIGIIDLFKTVFGDPGVRAAVSGFEQDGVHINGIVDNLVQTLGNVKATISAITGLFGPDTNEGKIDALTNFVYGLWDFTSILANADPSGLIGFLAPLMNLLSTGVGIAIDGLGQGISFVFSGIMSLASTIGPAATGLFNMIKETGVFNSIGYVALGILKGIAGLLMIPIGLVGAGIAGALSFITEQIQRLKPIAEPIFTKLKSKVDAFGKAVEDLGKGFKRNGLGGFVMTLRRYFPQFDEQLKNIQMRLFKIQNVSKRFKRILGKEGLGAAVQYLKQMYPALAPILDFTQRIAQWGQKASSALFGWVADSWSALTSMSWSDISKWFTDKFDEISNDIKEKGLYNVVKGWLGGISKAITESEPYKAFQDLIAGLREQFPLFDSTLSFFEKGIFRIQKFLAGPPKRTDADGNLLDGSMLEWIAESFPELRSTIEGIESFFTNVKVKGLGTVIQETFDSIVESVSNSEWFKNLQTTVTNFIHSIPFLDTIVTGITDFANNVKEAGVIGVFQFIGNLIIGGIKFVVDCLSALGIDAAAIINIISFTIFLSRLSQIVNFAAAIGRMSSGIQFAGIGIMLTGLALAIISIAGAVMMIATVPKDKLVSVIGSIAIILIELFGGLALIIWLTSRNVFSQDSGMVKTLIGAGLMVVMLAVSVGIIANAIRSLSNDKIDAEKLKIAVQGIIVIIGILAIVASVVAGLTAFAKAPMVNGLISIGIFIVAFAAAVGIITWAVSSIDLSDGFLDKLGVVVGIVFGLLFVTAIMAVFVDGRKLGDGLWGIGIVLIGMALALAVIVGAIALFPKDLDGKTFGQAITAVAAIMAAILLFVIVVSLVAGKMSEQKKGVGNTLMSIGVMLIGAAVAIFVIVAAMGMLVKVLTAAKTDWSTIGQVCVLMIVAIAGVCAMFLALGYFGKHTSASSAFGLIGMFLILVALALIMLEFKIIFKNAGEAALFAGVLVGAVLAVALAFGLMCKIAKGTKGTTGSLIAMALGIAAIAAVFYALGSTGTSGGRAIAYAFALSVALLAISGALAIMKKCNVDSKLVKPLLAFGACIVLVGIGAVILAAALKTVTETFIELADRLGSPGWAMLALVVIILMFVGAMLALGLIAVNTGEAVYEFGKGVALIGVGIWLVVDACLALCEAFGWISGDIRKTSHTFSVAISGMGGNASDGIMGIIDSVSSVTDAISLFTEWAPIAFGTAGSLALVAFGGPLGRIIGIIGLIVSGVSSAIKVINDLGAEYVGTDATGAKTYKNNINGTMTAYKYSDITGNENEKGTYKVNGELVGFTASGAPVYVDDDGKQFIDRTAGRFNTETGKFELGTDRWKQGAIWRSDQWGYDRTGGYNSDAQRVITTEEADWLADTGEIIAYALDIIKSNEEKAPDESEKLQNEIDDLQSQVDALIGEGSKQPDKPTSNSANKPDYSGIKETVAANKADLSYLEDVDEEIAGIGEHTAETASKNRTALDQFLAFFTGASEEAADSGSMFAGAADLFGNFDLKSAAAMAGKSVEEFAAGLFGPDGNLSMESALSYINDSGLDATSILHALMPNATPEQYKSIVEGNWQGFLSAFSDNLANSDDNAVELAGKNVGEAAVNGASAAKDDIAAVASTYLKTLASNLRTGTGDVYQAAFDLGKKIADGVKAGVTSNDKSMSDSMFAGASAAAYSIQNGCCPCCPCNGMSILPNTVSTQFDPLNAYRTAYNASQTSDSFNSDTDTKPAPEPSTTNITFNQNNSSARHLNPTEIYRNTRNLLDYQYQLMRS